MGLVVNHKKYGLGKTKYTDSAVNGKIIVYFDSGKKILCKKDNLEIKGYWD